MAESAENVLMYVQKVCIWEHNFPCGSLIISTQNWGLYVDCCLKDESRLRFAYFLGGADKNTDAYCGIYGAGQDDFANDSPPDGAEDPLFSGQNR